MKTLDYILGNYKEFGVFLDDRFGVRLCQFLTEEQAKQIGFEISDEAKEKGEKWLEPKPFTEENILDQLRKDVEFGFEKALDQRGISSSLMYEVARSWNKVLENELADFDDYSYYGLPLFKKTALLYDFNNEIGDDYGDEDYYNE